MRNLLFGIVLLMVAVLLIAAIGGAAVKTVVDAWKNGGRLTPPSGDRHEKIEDSDSDSNEHRPDENSEPNSPRIWK